jgi:hypothetical protein
MNAKKDFPALLLSAIISMGYASASEKPQHKIRFGLKPQGHYLKCHAKKSFSLFDNLQERMCRTGEDYAIIRAPLDNMPIIVPNMSKYKMPLAKPGPEWYGDDKFVIKPSLEWNWHQDWEFKELYKNRKFSQGILLYEWKHK